jgi:hypothetical protein
MRLFETLPLVAAAAFLLYGLVVATRGAETPIRNTWLVPAAASALFLGWSLYAIATEGLLGFWAEHTRNAWGNQIWMDLLLGIAAAWALIVPEAKRLGMHPLPWLLFVASTGNIGLMAMLARLLFLRERNRSNPA